MMVKRGRKIRIVARLSKSDMRTNDGETRQQIPENPVIQGEE